MGELGFDPVDEVQQHPAVVGVGDVVPDPLVGGGGHPLDLLGEQLQRPVEVVAAPVVDGAAADRLVGVPVVAGVSVTADEALVVEDLAQRAAADQGPERPEVTVPPAVLIDGQRQAAVVRCGDLPVGLLDRQAERLLHHDRLAGRQCAQGPVGVGVGRRGHDHQVDTVVGEQLLGAIVRAQGGRELAGGSRPGGIGVAHRGQLEAPGGGDGGVVLVADGAVAKDADPDGGGVTLTADPPQDAVHDPVPGGVVVGRCRRPHGQRADPGRGPPGGHRMVAVGHVGGQQHLDVVGDLVDQRPAVVDHQVPRQPVRDIARSRSRPHPDLVQGRDAGHHQSGGVGGGAQQTGPDEQDRPVEGEQGVSRCAEHHDDVCGRRTADDLHPAAAQVGRQRGLRRCGVTGRAARSGQQGDPGLCCHDRAA